MRQTGVVVMFCTGLARSAHADHKTLAVAAHELARKNKVEYFLLPPGRVFVSVPYVLYALP